MSSIANTHSESPENEQLVAYLDGELSPEECRAVEERLAADEGFRQQLRDLDTAWEALGALPPATVDDSFARTTIELACVQAEKDLSQRNSLVVAETHSKRRWWIAGAVTAAILGFIFVQALAAHRNNGLLVDLPVIQEANVLSRVENVSFLRQLAKSVSLDELKQDPRKEKDDAAYQRELEDFRQLNAESLSQRRDWVEALPADRKAQLAERTRSFEDPKKSREERDRLRALAKAVSRDPSLEEALIAYGQWLGRQSAGKLNDLHDKMQNASTADQVASVREMVQQEYEQAARHLSEADAKRLRTEFIAVAEEQKPELLKNTSGREHEVLEHVDVSKGKGASYVFFLLTRDAEKRRDVANRLVASVSPEQQAHYEKLRNSRDHRLAMWQLAQWIDDAMHPSWGQADLEKFFEEKLSNEDRQKLLEMPRLEMKSRLEQMYAASELGDDFRGPLLRDFAEGFRGIRSGRGDGPPEGGRPG
ncbi:MAG TPA: zf-HC2 domain-containing protein, partial [Lacipirellulaceae bacterium]|nr:zf-HC2 domain-containing protein [Lacipirellulaceae bacterium]